ncbi:MAG: PAS domain-containing protein [bacterium]
MIGNKRVKKRQAEGEITLRKKITSLEKKLVKLEQKEQRIDDLNLINSLNIAVSRGDDLGKVLNLLARETRRLFHCHGAAVYIMSLDKNFLILQQNPQIAATFKKLPKAIARRIPSEIKIHLASTSIYQKILRSRKPQLTNDAVKIKKMMAEFTDSSVLRKLVPLVFKNLGSRSVMSIPLVTNGEVIGMMDVSRETPFTKLESKRFEIISKEMTIILRNFRTQEALQKSKDLTKKFIDAATQGFVLFDSELNIIAINDYIRHTFDIKETEVVGMNIVDASIASWESGRYEMYKKVLNTGKPLQFKDIIAPDKYGSLHLNLKAFKVGDGLGMIIDDITEQKKTEEKLRLANEKLLYLVTSTSAVIYTSETKGDYGATFISDNVTELFGFEPRQFTGQSDFWLMHVHPDDTQRVEIEVTKLFDKKLHTHKYRFRCKDGRYVWVSDKMKLLFDEDGKPLEIIGYLTIVAE